MDTISKQELAELLVETGQAHHEAYRESDGVDPEWAGWYAPYLQAKLGHRLGRRPTRSELTYLLIKAERAHAALDDGSPWAVYYADVLLEG